MIFNSINLIERSAGLTTPFVLEQIAALDHFALYLYIARGAVGRHMHQMQDELFYVVEGELTIDSSAGSVVLHEGEFALVPRGVEHASSSLLNTTVLLAQASADPERKNGHGRLLHNHQRGVTALAPRRVLQGMQQPFFSVSLTQVDEIAVRAAWCEGVVGWHRHAEHDELLLVIDGQLNIDTEAGSFSLMPNEMVIIPHKRVHRLSTSRRTLLISLVHADVSAAAQMGRAD